MRAVQFLHNHFRKSSIKMDKRIVSALFACVDALLCCQMAMLVTIGRAIHGQAKVKHKIKRTDRLLGNKNLHGGRLSFYQEIARMVIGTKKSVVIIVDWSGLTPCGEYHLLRAAIPCKGRALSILEKTYPEKRYASPRAHREFINELEKILPSDCTPVIVTDAGFRVPWFKLVTGKGWDFIGRVRHETQCRPYNGTWWNACKLLHDKATTTAKYLGRFMLAKSNPFECEFYLIKQKKRHRVKKNLKGKKVACSVSKKHERREREPWLLATSLSNTRQTAKKVIKIYKLRMGIEENFRDMKNTRNGFGYRHSRTLIAERIDILMLIITLAMLIVWLLGMLGIRNEIGYQLQTNSVRSRKVLSVFFIGSYLYSENIVSPVKHDFIESMQSIQDQIGLGVDL